MESFDQSLKYLLHQQPADFIHFALGPSVIVLGPIPSALPSRGRDIDGAYSIQRDSQALVAHFEFHRRNQSVEDLAIDVGEAQIRLYRREKAEVISLVWDLYGAARGPVTEARAFVFGAKVGEVASQVAYVRVNLRSTRWNDLLSRAPPSLWPLVALAQGGASEEAVRTARDQIQGRTDLTASQQADHLAVLWFVAEAEDVSVRVMKAYIAEEKLMASTLYQSIIEKGEARGEVRGRAQERAGTILRVLTRRLGSVDPAVATRIRGVTDSETLDVWLNEALDLQDAEGARRLVEKIATASLS